MLVFVVEEDYSEAQHGVVEDWLVEVIQELRWRSKRCRFPVEEVVAKVLYVLEMTEETGVVDCMVDVRQISRIVWLC